MRVLSVTASNFGSYQELSFDFESKGLIIISGPTGAGKSTLCDLVPWALFGTTAKGGAVDEVVGWGSDTTSAKLSVLINGETYVIYRSRGKANDLCFGHADAEIPTRGKDLKDTQKMLNQLLGMDAETYLAGAYLHEFSLTSQFFTTTAKNRRATTEQLADLTLAIDLQTKASEFLKDLQKDQKANEKQLQEALANLKYSELALSQSRKAAEAWKQNHAKTLEALKLKSEFFEENKAREVAALLDKERAWELEQECTMQQASDEISRLQEDLQPGEYFEVRINVLKDEQALLSELRCAECGSPKKSDRILIISKELHKLDLEKMKQNTIRRDIADLERKIAKIKTLTNPYAAQLNAAEKQENFHFDQYEQHKNEKNPHQVDSLIQQVELVKLAVRDVESERAALNEVVADIEELQEIVAAFRATLISRTINQLECSTNRHLERHFDGELRVKFEASDNDKVDVEITKDGHACSFTQLSKGQRQVLKLCFGISVMRAVSDHKGVQHSALFFDEALDGMSDSVKEQAYGLLEQISIEYQSVFVVDHSEHFKSLFSNLISVELRDGNSTIYEQVES